MWVKVFSLIGEDSELLFTMEFGSSGAVVGKGDPMLSMSDSGRDTLNDEITPYFSSVFRRKTLGFFRRIAARGVNFRALREANAGGARAPGGPNPYNIKYGCRYLHPYTLL
jgi:hypothetical protein